MFTLIRRFLVWLDNACNILAMPEDARTLPWDNDEPGSDAWPPRDKWVEIIDESAVSIDDIPVTTERPKS